MRSRQKSEILGKEEEDEMVVDQNSSFSALRNSRTRKNYNRGKDAMNCRAEGRGGLVPTPGLIQCRRGEVERQKKMPHHLHIALLILWMP